MRDTQIGLVDSKIIVFRLTALWGFSESVIGGFLHAARIPVTGLVLGGFAAIITSLIFYYSRNPRLIVSATLQVLLIKFVMSPHTPFAAYLAVMMEGLFATGIFYLLRSFSVAAVFSCVFNLVYSALQKLIVTTLLLGMGFWKALDNYTRIVVEQFHKSAINEATFSISYYIVVIYLGVHLAAGLLIGYLAIRMPVWVEKRLHSPEFAEIQIESPEYFREAIKARKRTSLVIPAILTALLTLSFIVPTKIQVSELMLMAARAIIFIILWFKVINPFLTVLAKKMLHKRLDAGKENILTMIDLFPSFRISYSVAKKQSRLYSYPKRIKIFIVDFLTLTLFSPM